LGNYKAREEEQRKNEGNGAVRTTIETVTTFYRRSPQRWEETIDRIRMAERKWKKEKDKMKMRVGSGRQRMT
jgi:hypothetical protein